MSFIQEHLLDYYYALSSGDSLEHNTMYFPQVDTLALDLGWRYNSTSNPQPDTLEVYAMVDGRRYNFAVMDGYSLTTPDPSLMQAGADFLFGPSTRVYLEVPADIKGKSGTLVFMNTAGTIGNAGTTAIIDNIEFDTGLQITDTSEKANDLAVFFSDAGDTSVDTKDAGVLLNARTSGTGIDRHELTFTNRQATAITITVTVPPSRFVNLAAVTGEWTFRDGVSSFTDGVTGGQVTVRIPPRGSVVLGVTAKMTADQVAQLGSQVVPILSSSLTVDIGTPDAGTGGKVKDRQVVNLFYLLDIGDDDPTDGVIKIAETVEGSVRSLMLESGSSTLDFLVLKDLGARDAARVALGSSLQQGSERGWLGIGQRDGKAWLDFAPTGIGKLKSGTAFRFQDKAELGLTWGGNILGSVKIEAAAAPKQTIGLELDELKPVLRAEIERVLADNPDHEIGILFPGPISDTVWDSVWSKIEIAILTEVKNALYLPDMPLERILAVTAGSGDVDFVYDPGSAQSGDITRSFATFDFDKETWDNTPLGAHTAAQRQYLLDSLFNRENFYEPGLNFLKDKVLLRSLLPDQIGAGQTHQILGRHIGAMLAHEIMHTFGLPDRYDHATGQPLGDAGLMNTLDSLNLTEEEKLIYGFALNYNVMALSAEQLNMLIAYLERADAAGALDGTDRGYLSAPPGSGGLPGGWAGVGTVTADGDSFVITEGPATVSGLRQTLTVPPGARTLAINVRTRLGIDASVPPDAFEVALLDQLGNALVGLTGLSRSDAAFNLQAAGTVRFSSLASVSVPVNVDGYETRTIVFDVSGLAEGTEIALYLDLIGFGAFDSSVVVDRIAFSDQEPANTAPSASGFSVELDEGGELFLDLGDHVSDAQGDPITIAIVSGPAHGTLEHVGGTVWRYRPPALYSGSDSFTFRGSDSELHGGAATVSITVKPVNDAPVIGLISPIAVYEGSMLTISPTAFDPDGSVLHWSLGDAPAGATIDSQTGRIPWLAPDGPYTTSFTIIVTDPAGASARTTASVEVIDVAPRIEVALTPHIVIGETASLVVTFIDPGPETLRSFSVDWGDGRIETFDASSTHATHVYETKGNYEIRVRATGSDEKTAEATARVAVSTPGLRVLAVDPFAWGLSVRFDAPFDRRLPNPYALPGDGEAPDIVVLDAEGRRVDGSIVFDVDDRGFTFIASGNGLAPGSYTLELRGDSHGWRNDFDTLEGDQAGVYRRGFTVADSTTAVRVETGLVLAGQRLKPDGSGLAVTIDQPGGVRSLVLDIAWNTTVLDLDGLLAALPEATVELIADMPGQRRYRISFETPTPAGSLTVARLTGSATSQFLYKMLDASLSVSVVEINGVTQDLAASRGLLAAALPGDADGDGKVDAADEALLAALAAKDGEGLSAWRQLDPNLLALPGGEPPDNEEEHSGGEDGDGSPAQPPRGPVIVGGARAPGSGEGGSSASALLDLAVMTMRGNVPVFADASGSGGSDFDSRPGSGNFVEACFVPVQADESSSDAADGICLMVAPDLIAREAEAEWTVIEPEVGEEAPSSGDAALCIVTNQPFETGDNALWRLVPAGKDGRDKGTRHTGEGETRHKVCFVRTGSQEAETGGAALSPEQDERGGDGALFLLAAAFDFRGSGRKQRNPQGKPRGINR